MRLKDEIVIVTGGGSGIGEEACLLIAKEGAIVAIGDIDSEGAMATSTKIIEAGGQSMHKRLDITDATSVESFVEKVLSQYGRVDVLINNAGGPLTFKNIVDCSESEWDDTFALNAKGTFLMSRAVLPSMIKNKSGSIVNISSLAGLVGTMNRVAYSASKGAIIALTRAMAADHGRDGIRVNCICPGAIATKTWLRNLAIDPDGEAKRKIREDETLLGRLGDPKDVAEAIIFLASRKSSWVTGLIMPIDGGSTVS